MLHFHGLDRDAALHRAPRSAPPLTCTATTVPGSGVTKEPASATLCGLQRVLGSARRNCTCRPPSKRCKSWPASRMRMRRMRPSISTSSAVSGAAPGREARSPARRPGPVARRRRSLRAAPAHRRTASGAAAAPPRRQPVVSAHNAPAIGSAALRTTAPPSRHPAREGPGSPNASRAAAPRENPCHRSARGTRASARMLGQAARGWWSLRRSRARQAPSRRRLPPRCAISPQAISLPSIGS